MGTLVRSAHSALFYRDAAELVTGVVPFLLGGLAEGAVVGAALPGPHLELVRSGLGAAAERVKLFDKADVGRPEDIAGVVLFLCGPGSAYMTGQVLWVNGGGLTP